MPVVAAAPEKITPLIKRLRVVLGFTDVAPFFVLGMHADRFDCMRFSHIVNYDRGYIYLTRKATDLG